MSLESHFGNFICPVQVFIPPLEVKAYLLPLQLFLLTDGQVPCSWDPPQFPVRWPRAVTYTANSLHVSKCCKLAKKQSVKPKFTKDMYCRWFYILTLSQYCMYVRYISFIFLQLIKVSACAVKIRPENQSLGCDLTRKLDSGA